MKQNNQIPKIIIVTLNDLQTFRSELIVRLRRSIVLRGIVLQGNETIMCVSGNRIPIKY